MRYRWLLVALCFPCMLVMPIVVYDINRGPDEPGRSDFWLGIIGLIASVTVLECGRRYSGELWDENLRKLPPDARTREWKQLAVLQWGFLIATHAAGLMAFATTMDGGTRWAATRWVYPIYAVPALVLVVLRWKMWSWPERLFLRWGWAPVLGFGVPLAVPRLLAAGWVEVR